MHTSFIAPKCAQLCVGQIGRTLGTCFKEHLADIKQRRDKPVVITSTKLATPSTTFTYKESSGHTVHVCGSEVTGERPHGSSFRLLLHSHHSGFVGTISTLFCYVNIKLVLFVWISIVCLYEIVIWVSFVAFIPVLALRCNPIDFIRNQNGGP